MKKILEYFGRHLGVVVFSLLVSFAVGGVIYAATTIYNNFYGQTTINQTAQEQEQNPSLGGNLDATGGIQDASAPVTTLSNVDVYDLDVTNRLAVDGITTISQSYDGFVAGNSVLTISTTSPITVQSNTSGVDWECAGGSSYLRATSTNAFASFPNIAIATSSASVAGTNLLASTTIATSSQGVMIPLSYTKNFILRSGEKIMAMFGDYIIGSTASSTAWATSYVTPSIPCWLLGQ